MLRPYRCWGLILDDRQHRVLVRKARTSWARRGPDPGVALLVILALLLLGFAVATLVLVR